MSGQQMTHAEVLAFALAEAGLQHSVEEVDMWLEGDTATMPADLGPILDGIFANIDYHVRCMQARLLVDQDVVDEGLRKVASLPGKQLRAKAAARRKGAGGEMTLHVKPIKIPARINDTLVAIAAGLHISRQALIELWLEGATEAVIHKTRNIVPKEGWNKAQRKMGYNEVTNLIRRHRRKRREQA